MRKKAAIFLTRGVAGFLLAGFRNR